MTSSISSSSSRSRPIRDGRVRRVYRYRHLLLDVGIVAVVFAAVNLAIFLTSQYFVKERRYHLVVERALARPDIRILFAGDSHFATPLNHLDEDPTSHAYSVAFGGDSPREMFAKLRYVVGHEPRVDTLIVSADPHMFGDGRVQSANRSFANRYFLAAGDRSGLRDGWIAALLNEVPLFNSDFIQYLRKALTVRLSRSGPTAPEDAVRASETDMRWESLTDQQRSAIARKTGLEDHHGVGEHKEPFYWYSRIFALAREHHIRVIGLRMPVHPDYGAQVPSQRIAEIDDFMRKEGVTQITDLRSALGDPHDFEDPDHINEKGAAKVLGLLEKDATNPSFTGAFGRR